MSKKICKSWTRSSSETVEISHVWTIENFSLRKDEILYSSEFSSPQDFNTRKWKVKLYPNKENKGYLALYLILIPNKTCGGNIDVNYSFSMHDGKGNCLIGTGKTNDTFSKTNSNWGYIKVCKMDELLSKLTNDVLKITCDLSYFIVSQNVCGTQETPIQKIKVQTSFKDLSDNFGTLLTEPVFLDVTICVVGGDEKEKTEFKAHWLILAARSPYFATMFRIDFKEKRENKVEIKDVKPEIFKGILNFIYTGKIEPKNMSVTSAKDFIVSADRFVLLGLKKVAEKFLVSSKLTVQNASDLLIFADTYSAETLKASATDLVAKNLKQVVETGGWDELNRRHPHLTKELVLRAFDAKKAESDSESDSTDNSSDE